MVPFCPFYFGVSLLKLNSRKKGTLIIIHGLLTLTGEPSSSERAAHFFSGHAVKGLGFMVNCCICSDDL